MEFDTVVLQTADSLRRALQFISDDVKQKCEEIRLRGDLPVCLTVGGSVLFVGVDSSVCNTLPKNPLIATKKDVDLTLSLLCKQSIYLHENEIKQGFISLSGGGRAGVCGIFNSEGMLVSVSSINIRIARQIFGCANGLLPYIQDGLLIAGPPGSGKTTMLRDLVRLVSNGENGRYCRVTVIDSRGEIYGGGLDLGINTDVLHIEDKAKGVDIALRTMFPHYIAFDEIGTDDEFYGVQNCFNAGVKIITTAHCNNKNDAFERSIIRKITQSGAVGNVAVLSENFTNSPCIIPCKDLKQYVIG